MLGAAVTGKDAPSGARIPAAPPAAAGAARPVQQTVSAMEWGNNSFLFCLLFQFLELFRPGLRGSITDFVRSDQSANFGYGVLRANIGVRVATTRSLDFAIARIKRRVKGSVISHVNS